MRLTKDSKGRTRELNLNKIDIEKYSKNLSSFTNLNISMITHILELYYQTILYDLKNKSLDDKLDDLRIEIPFIGGLYLKYENDKIVVDHFELEYEFENDVAETIKNKECKLEKMIEESYIKKILSKYEELI